MAHFQRRTGWTETTFGELVEFFDHKRVPLSGKERSERQGPYPYYGASGIIDYIDDYIFDGRYLLIAEDGENLRSRKTPIAFFASGRFWVNNHAHIVRARDGVANDYFLMHYIEASNISGFITGAAQPKLTQANLKLIPVRLPPLPTQQKIAAILSAYDDLIENNLRRIKILEEMAQTIYREWFVKFRFPGHQKYPPPVGEGKGEGPYRLVDSPLGKIPEGWEVGTLDNVLATLESGSRPKGGIDPEARGVPSIGAENIIGLGQYDYTKEKFVTREFFNNMKRGHVQSGDVLLYKDGAKIGRKSMFRDGFPHEECCINEHVFILRTNGRCSQNYLFFWLDQPEMTQNIINLNANAAQPGINQSGVRSLPILLPPVPLLEKAEEILDPIMGAIFNYAKKNNILRQTRDLLLPKLISGELDVSEMDIKTGINSPSPLAGEGWDGGE